MSQMCAFEQLNPTAGKLYGDETCPAIIHPGTPSYIDCNFSLAAGQPSNYKDAELIKQYNGAAVDYISWDNVDSPQHWYNYSDPSNYVFNVCSDSPY